MVIFDPGFEIYVKNAIRSRLEMSGNQFLTSNMTKLLLESGFFSNPFMRLGSSGPLIGSDVFLQVSNWFSLFWVSFSLV